jgi:integrase
MARTAKILTERQAQALRPTDSPVFDGKVTGLMLTPTKTGAKRWTLRFTSPVTGKRRDMGLGSYPEVTILEARDKGLAQRRLLDKGLDPINERNRERETAAVVAAELTFEKAARTKHEELKPGWKNDKHKKQWIATLETYVFPKIGGKKLDAITPADCADVLRPIWLAKPETASRTRQRMQAVMDWACAHGHIVANPVAVVDHLLPQQNAHVEHQPAMPWRTIPAFIQRHLANRGPNDTTRAALLFLILTAARSGEIRGATWHEISPNLSVWTIPPERMKMKKSHRVPLPDQAVTLLRALKQQKLHDVLIFPSRRQRGDDKTALSDMTLTKFLRDMNAQSDTDRVATAHGFRSSFRDWASEQGYARDLAERALAHVVKDETEAAYHRTDLFNQRSPMMQAWADFLLPASAEIIPLHAAG